MCLRGALTIVLVLAVPVLSPGADDFVVIVHPSVIGAQLRRSNLAAIFLRNATRWGGGKPAVPVDQSATSPVRRAFSDAVIGMPAGTVVQYWQKQMFEGGQQRPPVVKGSDAEVIAFVASTEGAVGYVSKAAALPPEVRAVAIIE